MLTSKVSNALLPDCVEIRISGPDDDTNGMLNDDEKDEVEEIHMFTQSNIATTAKDQSPVLMISDVGMSGSSGMPGLQLNNETLESDPIFQGSDSTISTSVTLDGESLDPAFPFFVSAPDFALDTRALDLNLSSQTHEQSSSTDAPLDLTRRSDQPISQSRNDINESTSSASLLTRGSPTPGNALLNGSSQGAVSDPNLTGEGILGTLFSGFERLETPQGMIELSFAWMHMIEPKFSSSKSLVAP